MVSFIGPVTYKQRKVYNSCVRVVFWPKRCEDTGTFISPCHECHINKNPIQALAGLLYLFEVLECFCDVFTTKFLTDVPMSENGFDIILAIVEKLSKRVFFCRR